MHRLSRKHLSYAPSAASVATNFQYSQTLTSSIRSPFSPDIDINCRSEEKMYRTWCNSFKNHMKVMLVEKRRGRVKAKSAFTQFNPHKPINSLRYVQYILHETQVCNLKCSVLFPYTKALKPCRSYHYVLTLPRSLYFTCSFSFKYELDCFQV